MRTIRVQLPPPLRTLAGVTADLEISLEDPVTVEAVLDRIEGRYPMLAGTIREHGTGKRRAYLRFFAAGEDISHDPLSRELPESVVRGAAPFIILGAISGG